MKKKMTSQHLHITTDMTL